MSVKCELQVDYQYDFELLGLVSKVKEYKLAWSLNRTLGLNLAKSSDLVINFLKDQTIVISNFIFQSSHSTFRLLKNEGWSDESGEEKTFFLPEISDIDYLLMVTTKSDDFDFDHLIKTISITQHIESVSSIRVHSLEHKENLIF